MRPAGLLCLREAITTVRAAGEVVKSKCMTDKLYSKGGRFCVPVEQIGHEKASGTGFGTELNACHLSICETRVYFDQDMT